MKYMIKAKLLLTLIVLTASVSIAQTVEFTPLAGYSFNGSVSSYYGHFDMKNDMVFGGLINIEVEDETFVELSYRRSNPEIINTTASFFQQQSFDVGMEHYQIGILREFSDENVKPFSQFSMWVSRYWERGEYNNESWDFSINLGLGAKIFFNDVIGIRLQTNLLMPLEMDGIGLMCGFGSGGSSCGGGVTFNVPIIHWELAGGLIFRISN